MKTVAKISKRPVDEQTHTQLREVAQLKLRKQTNNQTEKAFSQTNKTNNTEMNCCIWLVTLDTFHEINTETRNSTD